MVYEVNGVKAIMSMPWEASLPVLLNVFYHMKQEYISLGLGSEHFLRYQAFYEMNGKEHVPGCHRELPGQCY